MGWKNDARRLVIGERRELGTFEGYWIRPRKFSVQAKDEINAIQRRIQKSIDKKALISLMKKVKGSKEADQSEEEIEKKLYESMTDDELNSMLDAQGVETKDLIYTKILYGVAEHNFCDEEKSEDSKVLAADILDYEAIAQEIINVVEEFNRPLAPKKSPS
jgi:hypothetical protein